MDARDLVFAEAKSRGWKVIRRSNELGIIGIPCFLKKDEPGRCEVWVGVHDGSDQMQGGLDWQGSNTHVAEIRGLIEGKIYDRSGRYIGNIVQSNDSDKCTISIKKDKGDYLDAWDALATYMREIYGGFRADQNNGEYRNERPYTFEILGERNRDEVQWIDLVRGERVAIVGLGGVGSWIADFLTKADVAEIYGWDGDLIEDKNIIRMPGAVHPRWIGEPKARWFQDTYRQIHNKVHGRPKYVDEQNVSDMCSNITFAFLAVDNDKGRQIACNALASRDIPFIDVGISLTRENNQVSASIHVVTAKPYDDNWRMAIPQVDNAGQEIYGRLELPDISAMAAAFAVQSWRKVRGQVAQRNASECMVYRSESDKVISRYRD